MPEGPYEPPEGFVTLGQAQSRLKVSRTTLHRILREGRLPTFEDPRNKRVKLVKVEDVEEMLKPRQPEKNAAA